MQRFPAFAQAAHHPVGRCDRQRNQQQQRAKPIVMNGRLCDIRQDAVPVQALIQDQPVRKCSST